MKWARLTRDHRFLEMKHALYIPSLCLGLILPAGSFKNTYFIIFRVDWYTLMGQKQTKNVLKWSSLKRSLNRTVFLWKNCP